MIREAAAHKTSRSALSKTASSTSLITASFTTAVAVRVWSRRAPDASGGWPPAATRPYTRAISSVLRRSSTASPLSKSRLPSPLLLFSALDCPSRAGRWRVYPHYRGSTRVKQGTDRCPRVRAMTPARPHGIRFPDGLSGEPTDAHQSGRHCPASGDDAPRRSRLAAQPGAAAGLGGRRSTSAKTTVAPGVSFDRAGQPARPARGHRLRGRLLRRPR